MLLDIANAEDYAIARRMIHDYTAALKSAQEIASAPGMNRKYWNPHIAAIQDTLEKMKSGLKKYEALHPEMFPKGKAFEDDEGMIDIGICETENGLLMFDFGMHVKSFAIGPEEAIRLAVAIMTGAKAIRANNAKHKMN